LIFINFSALPGFAQKIGVKSNADFSSNDQLNNAFGIGIYLDIDDLTKKVDFIASFDLTGKQRAFPSEDIKISHIRYNFSLSSLYVVPVSEKFNF